MARKQPLEQDTVSPDVDDAAAKTRSYGINRFTLLGRMTADPEIRFTQSGKARLRFGLATSVAGVVAFHDLVAWERRAEILGRYGYKGRELYVEGRLTSRMREVEGQRIKQVDLVVDTFQLLGAPGSAPNESADSTDEGVA